MRRLLIMLLVVPAILGLSALPAQAATITVDTTSDNTSTNGDCTLRNAIKAANLNAAQDGCVAGSSLVTDTINFNIAGPAPYLMDLGITPLDTIAEAVVIDGTSEPDYAGTPLIVLDGGDALSNGLNITAGNSTVKGLVFQRFADHGIVLQTAGGNIIQGNYIGIAADGSTAQGMGNDGIHILSGSNTVGGTTAASRNVISANSENGINLQFSGASANVIRGNYIGTDAAGTADRGNGSAGILVNSAPNNLIGGSGAGEGNVISGNNGAVFNTGAVALVNSLTTGNVVRGNLIGTDKNGTASLANAGFGVFVGYDAANNDIGGTATGAGNTIAFNVGDAVRVWDNAGTGNAILGNSIHSNGGLGIDLGSHGSSDLTGTVTQNDGGDADTGPNNLQNFPSLLSAVATATDVVTVEYNFNSTASSSYSLEFFAGSACNDADPNDHGEGELFLGAATLPTNMFGNLSGTFTSSGTPAVQAGDVVTATATRLVGVMTDDPSDTSEFSECRTVQTPGIHTVNTADDELNSDGDCSLREAIETVNSDMFTSDACGPATATGQEQILFSIPGAGPHTIAPSTLGALPAVTAPVLIDGYSEPGAAMATSSQAATLMIELNGTSAGATANGLQLLGGDSEVRGLVINRFAENAIELDSVGSNTIEGNYLGTNVAGTADLGNGGRGVEVLGGDGNTIGGTSAAARNVISGNDADGVTLWSDDNVVRGNYVGTTADGSGDLGNDSDGIGLLGANNTVGGAAAGAGNLISGNGRFGVFMVTGGSLGNVVTGNLIGTTSSGSTALGNGSDGVSISGGADAGTVGGTAVGAGNTIAFNGGDGVYMDSGSHLILGNAIHGNDGLGIDIVPADGVTPNDAGDADAGANDLQNFPVLSSATATGDVATVSGTLNSTASTQFRIEVFSNGSCNGPAPNDFGEGQRFLGSMDVTTDGSGNASFTFVSSGSPPVDPGEVVTATATNEAAGVTSELSQCRAVQPPPQPQPAAMCFGKPATVTGTSGSDTLPGTNGADVIAGLGGNDVVTASGGKDLVCGGEGNDTVNAGGGKDRVAGEDGNDRLKGAGGNDRLLGGPGQDKCNGGSGRDKGPGCEVKKKIP